MSKTTLRKRISLVAVSALTAGVLSVVASPAASATHPNAGADNLSLASVTTDASLVVATRSNTQGSAVGLPVTNSGVYTAGGSSPATTDVASLGLLSKDTSSGTAQTATVLAGGALSLYARVSTAVSFTATAGTFSTLRGGVAGTTAEYSNDLKTAIMPSATISSGGTSVGVIWTAPSAVGTYTVNLLTGFIASTAGVAGARAPGISTGTSPTLSGSIAVTVVAASSGGSYFAGYSVCSSEVNTSSANVLGATAAGIDSTGSVKNGDSWSIDFDLNDAYAKDLDSGNIVVSATNGALVNLGSSGTTPVAGTASTDVEYGSASSRTVRVSQPTAGAPLTTTVTISYNGTTVCTKTVSIAGEVAKLTVANVGTQKLSTSTGSSQWMYQNIDLYSAGLFTVLATDSAGNIVATDGLGTMAAVAATLTTTVQAMTFPTNATSSSSTSSARFTLGSFQCGATAGQSSVKVQFTTTSTGKTVTSDAFNARCADDPYTYSVSLDKAAYTQGEIATATVSFKDSKGNASNSVTAFGASSWVLPFMTGVTFTMPTGASSTAVTKADGTVSYTFTVGTTTGVTAGTYTGVVEYSSPAGGTKATPTYKISTGGDTTTNADVLKSIVALIASINKQIQALQKLILKR